MKAWAKLAIVAFVLLVAASIPYATISAPDWTVTVVDTTGAPVQGTLVREIYRNYSEDSEDHIIDENSDADGLAHFPSQVTRGSWIRRTFETLSSSSGVAHAAMGPQAYVVVFRGQESSMAKVDNGTALWAGSPASVRSKVVLTHLVHIEPDASH